MAALQDLGALRQPEPDSLPLPDAANVDMPDDETTILVDPDTGAVTQIDDDGSAVVDFSPNTKRDKTGVRQHDANLAEYIDEGTLKSLGERLLEAIEADDESRIKWVNTRKRGLELLGLDIENARGDVGASSSPMEGMSTVRHPLLLEAVIRFQANARGELLPSDGPVKVRVDAKETPDSDDLAEALEKDFNHYLTTTATEYYPDTDRAFFNVGFAGCAFKKVYNCPLRRRPVSESVDGSDIIVSASATDIKNAARFTHQIMMRRSTLKRMQIVGAYRDVPLATDPVEDLNQLDRKKAETVGQNTLTQRPEDNRYTVYETYTEIDPSDLGIDESEAPEGLPLPYKVTLNKDDRTILEIRRNWREDDEDFGAIQWFVKYPFVPTHMGFWDIGLVNILGNTTQALTAAWRIALDSGMFANFPGFIYAQAAGRQVTNEFRIPPGGGMPLQTGGLPLQQSVMPLPYKDVTAGMLSIMQQIEQSGQRLGSTAEIQVGEGRQDAPVGTTIALIEQATKVLDAVHKRLHQAQTEEFGMLKERFREDPEAFWRSNRQPARPWQREEFLQALDDYDLVPVADPNASTHMHRIMKAQAALQMQGAYPDVISKRDAVSYALNMVKIGLPLQPPPDPNQPPPPDPKAQAAQATIQAKQQAAQLSAAQKAQQSELQAHEVALESQDRAADRQAHLQEAQIKAETERLKALADLANSHADRVQDAQQSALDQIAQTNNMNNPPQE